ncbi:hypothetical protein RJ641_017886 [Dillenia turbinata]|uniref:DUF7392 domain-containing protein n=1 Tax=Dillenia turbinata TaxID=194707 RepID=A0AAN8UKG2_9MAGN
MNRMACYVPFNNRNLDISLFVFRPMVVIVDELIIWYGAWMKRSSENKELLNAALLSMLENVSSLAILTDHRFYDACAGESKDGSPAAKFYTGDTVSLNAAMFNHEDVEDLSYACLALFRSRFVKMDGTTAGVCLNGKDIPRVICLFVWRSLQSCYSYVLNRDYKKIISPYLDRFSVEIKYDIFRVAYVTNDNVLDFQFFPCGRMLQSGEAKEEDPI